MPLSTGTTKESRQKNIKTEIAAGKDPKQAVAIGYAKQRSNSAKKAASARSKDAMKEKKVKRESGLHKEMDKKAKDKLQRLQDRRNGKDELLTRHGKAQGNKEALHVRPRDAAVKLKEKLPKAKDSAARSGVERVSGALRKFISQSQW